MMLWETDRNYSQTVCLLVIPNEGRLFNTYKGFSVAETFILFYLQERNNKLSLSRSQKQKSSRYANFLCVGGERGIRTPGTSRYGGFQDRCNRPLYHLSESDAKVIQFFESQNTFQNFLLSLQDNCNSQPSTLNY